MRKQANRKVPQRRMCLRSLRKKAEYGRDIFGSACVRAALVLSLAAGALTLPSAAFPVMAETAADASESASGNVVDQSDSLETAVQTDASVISVDYNNLEQLVQNNRNLKNALDNYTSNKETYESMLKTLEDERDYMKFMQEKYEDDAETKATYKMNASMLNMSISQITKQLESQESKTQTTSRQKTIDSYVLTAQSLMRTYNQMNTKTQAEEKNYQAAQSSYQAALKKQSAGIATAADVMEASDTMQSAKNRYESYRQQAANARFKPAFCPGPGYQCRYHHRKRAASGSFCHRCCGFQYGCGAGHRQQRQRAEYPSPECGNRNRNICQIQSGKSGRGNGAFPDAEPV